jgi:hypothetical protein
MYDYKNDLYEAIQEGLSELALEEANWEFAQAFEQIEEISL